MTEETKDKAVPAQDNDSRDASRREFLRKAIIASGVATAIVQSLSADDLWAQASGMGMGMGMGMMGMM